MRVTQTRVPKLKFMSHDTRLPVLLSYLRAFGQKVEQFLPGHLHGAARVNQRVTSWPLHDFGDVLVEGLFPYRGVASLRLD